MKYLGSTTALLSALAASLVLSANCAQSQEARYGTRSPLTCGAPVRAKPTFGQIKNLIQCNFEKKTNYNISLVDIESVQAGGMRAYSQYLDSYATGIDTSAQVLPIRGSLTTYLCSPVEKLPPHPSVYDHDNTKKNCLVVRQPKAEGKCYINTFGDWWCGMSQSVATEDYLHDQAPPSTP